MILALGIYLTCNSVFKDVSMLILLGRLNSEFFYETLAGNMH